MLKKILKLLSFYDKRSFLFFLVLFVNLYAIIKLKDILHIDFPLFSLSQILLDFLGVTSAFISLIVIALIATRDSNQ
ncbi:hypothetical protein IGK47_004126 [Enterococcus sp. AZ007]